MRSEREKSADGGSSAPKHVLVTGAGSYVGESFAAYAREHYGGRLATDTMDMHGDAWRKRDFSPYDTVFHVAGIAHADIGNVSDETKRKYYEVNTELAIAACRKAKEDGVKQFILMSSVIIYGDSAPCGKRKVIGLDTRPRPSNFYGDSKWRADRGCRKLEDDGFKVAALRCPMIYGRGSKGNYPKLAGLAGRLPVFPDIGNERSMLYIGNLCELICLLVLSGRGGTYFPQNAEYTRMSDMVRMVAEAHGKRVRLTRLLNPAVWMASRMPGKCGVLMGKAFGNCVYRQEMSRYEGMDYQKYGLAESVTRTEMQGGGPAAGEKDAHGTVLVVASIASMIDQFCIPNIKLLLRLGYGVDVAANFVEGNTCTDERVQELLGRLDGMGVDCYQIDFDRNAADMPAVMKSFRQLDAVMGGTAEPINGARHRRMEERKYAFIHAHSPVGGAVGRIAARRHGIKSIYTAHGFHFYDGAPLKNWLLFYPVEWGLSWVTDVLVTINREDYRRARKRLHAKKTVYVPGVGVDIEKFRNVKINRDEKRTGLGLQTEDIMLLSVGELNENKNHRIVIEALGSMDKGMRGRLHYFIAGKGELRDELMGLAAERSVNLHMLGFRGDVPELLSAADIFLLPSVREGLNVGLMEAMASGLPVIASDIRGNRDLIAYPYLVKVHDTDAWERKIEMVVSGSEHTKIVKKNQKLIGRFSASGVNGMYSQIFREMQHK